MSKLNSPWQRALLLLTVFAIAIGIFCRFVNIDRKIYWHDETFTSLRISGFTEREMVEDLRQRQSFNIGYVTKYQTVNPERGMLGTVMGLAQEEPQLPPLYFVGARLWAQVFGSSVASVRVFPALISLLALPAVYWLCWELFQSQVTGAIAIMLIATSPFHVLYAQESRLYSLWTVMILVASAALLRALRRQTRSAWLLYALSLATCFYSHLVTLFVVVAYSVYVLLRDRLQWTKNLRDYLFATALGILALVPWLAIVITNRSQISKVLNVGAEKWAVSPSSLIAGLFRQPGKLLYDVNAQTSDPLIAQWFQRFFTVATVILILYALYVLIRTTQQQVWLFVLGLVLSTSVGLVVQDLVIKGQGGGASVSMRYQIPFYLGLQIAIAYLLSYHLTHPQKNWQQKIWQVIFVAIFSASIFSSALTVSAKNWWTKGPTGLEGAFGSANIVNQMPNPVLVTDCPSWDLTQFSYLLNPQIPVVAQPHCYVCGIRPAKDFSPDFERLLQQYSDVLIFPGATQELIAQVKTRYNVVEMPVQPKPSQDVAVFKVSRK